MEEVEDESMNDESDYSQYPVEVDLPNLNVHESLNRCVRRWFLRDRMIRNSPALAKDAACAAI